MRNFRAAAGFAFIAAMLLAGTAGAQSPQATAPPSAGASASKQAAPVSKFALTSTSFDADGTIPTKYACGGGDVSPALDWKGAPEGTQSFAIIVDDPDNPKKTIVHWVIYDLSATANSLPEGMPDKSKLPDGSMQGKNEDGKTKYKGPCPPAGPAHHYFFKIYALDAKTGLKPKATKAEVEAAMKGHILDHAELIGRFQK